MRDSYQTHNSFFNNFSQIIPTLFIKLLVLNFQITYNNVWFEVSEHCTLLIKIKVFWDMQHLQLIIGYWCFWEACCLHLQGSLRKAAWKNGCFVQGRSGLGTWHSKPTGVVKAMDTHARGKQSKNETVEGQKKTVKKWESERKEK
jgi:hypothetical protein